MKWLWIIIVAFKSYLYLCQADNTAFCFDASRLPIFSVDEKRKYKHCTWLVTYIFSWQLSFSQLLSMILWWCNSAQMMILHNFILDRIIHKKRDNNILYVCYLERSQSVFPLELSVIIILRSVCFPSALLTAYWKCQWAVYVWKKNLFWNVMATDKSKKKSFLQWRPRNFHV